MKIMNIKWDTDDLEELAELPNEVDVKDIIPKGTCKEEYMSEKGFKMKWLAYDIAYWLSDKYGCSVNEYLLDSENYDDIFNEEEQKEINK